MFDSGYFYRSPWRNPLLPCQCFFVDSLPTSRVIFVSSGLMKISCRAIQLGLNEGTLLIISLKLLMTDCWFPTWAYRFFILSSSTKGCCPLESVGSHDPFKGGSCTWLMVEMSLDSLSQDLKVETEPSSPGMTISFNSCIVWITAC